ncbi:MAG TPA: patatin-like phospholipase family protein, partial [Catenuloplanes sp.]
MSGTALVLGGGGVTGVAWSLGLLAGLRDADVDLTDADLVVGTSAGSVVGAQITTGASLAELYTAELAEPVAEPVAEAPARIGARVLFRYAVAAAGTRDPQRFRARLGAMALAARTPSEEQRRQVIAARLPARDWPRRRLRVTAVDAHDGRFEVFDAGSGVQLLDAVGASCAVPGVWPPVSIGGRRYLDGGMRSPANADLAAG